MKSSIFGFLQRLVDLVAIILSFCLGYWYYHLTNDRSVPYSFFEFTWFGAFTGVLFLVVFHSLRLYENTVSLLHVVETKRLLIGWILGSLVLFASTFYFRFLDLSRIMVTSSLVISFMLLVLERSVMYHLHLLARVKSGRGKPVIIYGAGVVGKHLYKRIYHSPGLGLQVAGFLDDDSRLWGKFLHIGEVRRRNGNVVLGGLEKLEELKAKGNVHEVFVALPNAPYQRTLDIVQMCRKHGLNVSVVPPTYGHQMHNLEVEDIGGIPVIREKETHPHLLYPFFKRLFDIVVSSVALLVLSPIFLAIWLALKLDSPGPMIFRQKRVGLHGKQFDFFKFRTMTLDSNPYALTPTSSDDPRITRFGRWLRRSSLDELPQFWNVIKGDMSIVGPRPEMPFIVSEYNDEQKERLKVKPGITGVWQISAVRGEPIHANMEYDLFYIEHRSILLDIIIMVKTIATAIRGIGAV